MPKLIAKEKFYYAGRNVEAGEEFEAEANDVALLTHSVSPRAQHPEASTAVKPMAFKDQQAEESQQTGPMGRRQYRRRDMQAKE